MAEEVAGNVARCHKKESPGRLYSPAFARPEQAMIGFLNDIIDVAPSYQAVKIMTQRRLMRLHMGAKPGSKF